MRTRPIMLLLTVLAALTATACGSSSTTSSSSAAASSAASSSTASSSASGATTTATSSAGQVSYEGIPLESGPQLAPASTTQTGTEDGIKCAPIEQLAYHIHSHLAVFDNGTLYSLPAGIGIPGSSVVNSAQGPVAGGGQCVYWLHTHTSDGVIHVESPTARVYTLGDFFDIWHQPLTAGRVGSVHGKITAFFNGHLWTRNVRDIPLLPHGLIQLNIGAPAPPLMAVSWTGTHL